MSREELYSKLLKTAQMRQGGQMEDDVEGGVLIGGKFKKPSKEQKKDMKEGLDNYLHNYKSWLKENDYGVMKTVKDPKTGKKEKVLRGVKGAKKLFDAQWKEDKKNQEKPKKKEKDYKLSKKEREQIAETKAKTKEVQKKLAKLNL